MISLLLVPHHHDGAPVVRREQLLHKGNVLGVQPAAVTRNRKSE